MAARKKKAPTTRRGSKEAIAKRRAARQLNSVIGGGHRRPTVDGRTEKRRQRLIAELKEGRDGFPLKPIDFVSHVNDLLNLGESIATLRKHGIKPRKTEATEEVIVIVRQTQEAYDFHPEAWKLLGITLPGRSKRG